MKTCTECGAPLSDDDQFCLSCGADVESPATDNTPNPEENTEPAEQQPVQQEYTQQQPVQQAPIQQQPVQQQPAMYQQPAPQQPMQQYQQPMQQPGIYPQQPMPQYQQPLPQYQQPLPQYQQPVQQQRGSSNKTWLYVLIPLVVIGAVVAILFATGVFSGKKNAPNLDEEEVSEQIQLAEIEESSELGEPGEQSEENQPDELDSPNVTLCNITFTLPEDYKVDGRTTLDDSEACIIVPKGAPDRSNRLIVRIYPNKLDGIDGITNEEIGQLLHEIVDANAGVFANKEKSGFKLDRAYKIHYDDNANNSYFPHCYTYLNWTDREGKYSRSYTEATLVKRIVVSGSAIATDQGELNALTDIYSEVVQAANN